MPRDFIPSKEADVVNWSAAFSAYITANAAAVGLQSSQATSYAALHTSFADAFTTATTNSTRTPAAIEAKNDSKKLLIASARQLVGIVQKYPGTTNEQRSAMNITIPSDEPSPVP